jgi:hypothetical protein
MIFEIFCQKVAILIEIKAICEEKFTYFWVSRNSPEKGENRRKW